ncbi:ABC transporter ATP-binding protein [Sphingomonas sp. So64.6b]|uniref:ABC transporter ATP-binding protein n=1 Tax=Sphingomonas sp. So64.6b TaxID=2997354 RepID=UPI0016013564|nr:ABC transporter ATP-binding protein [Sphingomonas sp. So64.6b]QNA82907.1 ABC transporter ATP-binding protein [Sphingomonas sp. So64.6b]
MKSLPRLVIPGEEPSEVPVRGGGAIVASAINKVYETPTGPKKVLTDINFTVARGQKLAVLGRNGAGKSTLVKLIGGVERPTTGVIRRGMSMSWPLAFGGGFEAGMTGLDNIRFIARIYNSPIAETIERVDDFAELGANLLLPVKYYSSGMRARLAFALTLAIDFDCFLIDEVIAVGDQRFHQKCHDALFRDRREAAMILVSHDTGIIREYCSSALILKNGYGREFSDLDLAISIYATL